MFHESNLHIKFLNFNFSYKTQNSPDNRIHIDINKYKIILSHKCISINKLTAIDVTHLFDSWKRIRYCVILLQNKNTIIIDNADFRKKTQQIRTNQKKTSFQHFLIHRLRVFLVCLNSTYRALMSKTIV